MSNMSLLRLTTYLALLTSASSATSAEDAEVLSRHFDYSRSAIYSVTGPAITRISNGIELQLLFPALTRNDGEGEGDWVRHFELGTEDQAAGWRLRQVICDSAATSSCLIERHHSGRTEWGSIDLTRTGANVQWRELNSGRILDYDAHSDTIIHLSIADNQIADLSVVDFSSPSSGQAIWSARPDNNNAFARFLPMQNGERPILLMTGGPIAHWQVIYENAQSAARPSPGILNTAFGNSLYFSTSSSNLQQSWFGFTSIPTPGSSWGEDRLIYSGGGDAPRIATGANDGRLWREDQSAGFLPSGTLVAVTQEGAGLALSEVCRPSPNAEPIAQPLPMFDDWMADAEKATIYGGAPRSQALIVAKTDLSGQISLRGVYTSPPSSPVSAIASCGETEVSAVNLPLPPTTQPLHDVVRRSHTVTADDGAEISYDVIQREGRPGQILIRPYGAYGLLPEPFLARPLERGWVADGNTLIVPRLRGDAGSREWVEAGRGDYKQRAAGDLIAVSEDVLRRYSEPTRVNLVGISAGAFVSARAALQRPDIFDRVILISGVLDLSLSDAVAENSFDRDEYGAATGGFSEWLGSAPAPGELAPTFIVLHGAADEIVPIGSTANFTAYARNLGYPVRGHAYQDVGHNLANMTDILDDIVELW